MRGKVSNRSAELIRVGITPAYAGKSTANAEKTVEKKDHPRICGEKATDGWEMLGYTGSPPHMRGKGPLRLPTRCSGGITPAYAGKRA